VTDDQAPPIDRAVLARPVRLTWNGPHDATIVVAGIDLAPLCRGLVLQLDADDMPRLVLELDCLAVRADLSGTDVAVDPSAALALRALGWTPPVGGTHRIDAATTGADS
jgi:hypothetical protein